MRAESFFCNLGVLHGGLGIDILEFLIQNKFFLSQTSHFIYNSTGKKANIIVYFIYFYKNAKIYRDPEVADLQYINAGRPLKSYL